MWQLWQNIEIATVLINHMKNTYELYLTRTTQRQLFFHNPPCEILLPTEKSPKTVTTYVQGSGKEERSHCKSQVEALSLFLWLLWKGFLSVVCSRTHRKTKHLELVNTEGINWKNLSPCGLGCECSLTSDQRKQ